jgi:uncharacterized protein
VSISLHEAFVPTLRQIVGASRGLLDKAEVHCAATGTPPATLIGLSLAPDMLPLSFQVFAMMHHSAGALAGARAGVFSPARPEPGLDLAALKGFLETADAALAAVSVDELAELEGRPLQFSAGERQMSFLVRDFLLSFSLPNFFFHASMLYALLRHAGLPLAKPDFLGRPRLHSAGT